MKNQDTFEKEQKQKVRRDLLKQISVQESTGLWSNNIPVYKEHIVNRIKNWLNNDGNEIARQARREGWLSVTKNIGYENFTIPDKPTESLVGYLNLVLMKQ
ncbi:MAG: hypothetical protein ACXAAH_14475, partial [Promethearchaeota archaeon]